MVGLAVIPAALWWLGFFKKMQINESVFPGGTFIYSDWKGEIKSVGEAFGNISAEFVRIRDASKIPIRGHPMGIYYDDPSNLKNPSDFRACIGFLINKSEEGANQLIETFRNEGFKCVDVPRVQTIHGDFPLKVRMISYPMGAMKFYPASLRYIGEHKQKYENLFKQNSNQDSGSIELTIDNTIHFHWPMELREKFALSSYPRPEWKDANKYTDMIKKGADQKKTE